jgi:hypothetical protein
MLICAVVATFFITVISGPAGLEWLGKQEWYRRHQERRRALDAPVARVVYLPSAACREICEPIP